VSVSAGQQHLRLEKLIEILKASNRKKPEQISTLLFQKFPVKLLYTKIIELRINNRQDKHCSVELTTYYQLCPFYCNSGDFVF